MGQDTSQLLIDLGYSASEIEALCASQAIA
jgi:hypothetical protein